MRRGRARALGAVGGFGPGSAKLLGNAGRAGIRAKNGKSGMGRILLFLMALAWAGGALAQGLTALARVDAGASAVRDVPGGAALVLGLSQAVP